jgi:hypothetical protein
VTTPMAAMAAHNISANAIISDVFSFRMLKVDLEYENESTV